MAGLLTRYYTLSSGNVVPGSAFKKLCDSHELLRSQDAIKVELLAALESSVDRLCYACDLKFPFISTNTHQHPKGGILSCEAAEARAAIAKAKGE